MCPNHKMGRCPTSEGKIFNPSYNFRWDQKVSPNLVGCPTSEGAQSDNFYWSLFVFNTIEKVKEEQTIFEDYLIKNNQGF